MTQEQILKHLENQIDYFVYELKREIINSALLGHENQTIWDKFKGFMQNVYYGKDNINNPNLTKTVLGHGLGSKTNESRIVPLKNYKFFKEWHNNLESNIKIINENYSVPEIPTHLRKTQLNQIIDKWAINFKKAILDTIQLVAKPTETKPTETGTTETKPTETGTTETKPTETGTTETGTTETKPTETKPTETGTEEEEEEEETKKPDYIKANNLEEAVRNYSSGKDVISTRAWNIRGGEGIPHPYKSKRKISKTNIYIQDLPYILRFGDPRIDLIYYSDEDKNKIPSDFFKELLNLGRIETKENFYPHEINDEIKKTILRNRFKKVLKSTEGISLDEKKQKIKQEAENIVFGKDSSLDQIIQKIQEIHGIPPKPKSETPTETKPTETKPTETKPTETKPTEIKPTETKPTETKPTETGTAETGTAETKPTETGTTTLEDLKNRIAKSKIESNIDKYLIYSPRDSKYTNFKQEKLLNFLENYFNEYKDIFSEKFEEKIKSLPKIDYEIANIGNINNSSKIRDGLMKTENLEEFISTIKKISNLLAIEEFISNTFNYKDIEDSTKIKISKFIEQLSDNEIEYLKIKFLEFIKQCTRNEKNNLPIEENKSSYEEIENSINDFIKNKEFKNFTDYMIELIKHCHEKVSLSNITYATSDEADEILGY